MKTSRWFISVLIGLGGVIGLLLILQLRPSAAQPIGVLSPIGLSPAAALVAAQAPAASPKIGETFSVTIRASQLGARLSAFQFDLSFDASRINYLYTDAGVQLNGSGRPVICPLPVLTSNVVRVACASSGAVPGSNSDGSLAIITFRAAQVGPSALTLTDVKLIDDALTPALITAGTQDGRVTITGRPELAINKSGPTQALAGERITYTLTVMNTGTDAATNLVISDTLPAGADYVSGGTLAGNVVRFDAPSVSGAGGVITAQFTITATQTITNSLYAVTADGGAGAIGMASVTTQISSACDPMAGLNFSFAPGAPRVGQTVVLTATFTTGTLPITYTWNWGDGTPNAQNQFANHVFPLTNMLAMYTVTLTAANACPSSAQVQQTVSVWPQRVYLPLVRR